MAVAAALKSVIQTGRYRTLTYKLTFSGSYVTGGDTVNFATATNPNLIEHGAPDRAPQKDEAAFDDTAAGYTGEWVPGTTIANGKVKLFTSAGTETAAGAYPAAVTGDDMYLVIVMSKGKSSAAV